MKQLILIQNRQIQGDIPKDAMYQIKEVKKTRSSHANRYYWGVVIKLLSERTGYTKDEMHDLLKRHFLSYEKKGKKFTKSTAKLKVGEFIEYMDKVILLGETYYNIIFPKPVN